MRLAKLGICLTLMVALAACSTQPKFDYQPADIKRIGILVLLEDHLTHSHIGTTVFNNSDENRRVESFVPSETLAQLATDELVSRGYDVSRVQLPEQLEESDERVMVAGWSGLAVQRQYRPALARIIQEDGLDLIILFDSFPSHDYIGGSSVGIEGYGLYTRYFFGAKTARIYANIRGFGVNAKPVAYIESSGTPELIPTEATELTDETAANIEEQMIPVLEHVVQDTITQLQL